MTSLAPDDHMGSWLGGMIRVANSRADCSVAISDEISHANESA